MTTRSLSATLVVVATVGVLLAGCGGTGAGTSVTSTPVAGGTEPETPTPTASSDPDSELAESEACLQGVWVEDMLNLKNQWQSSSPGGEGLPVTSVTGQNTLTVTDSSMTYTLDMTVVTEQTNGGITMNGESVTSGSASLDYEVHGPTSATLGPVTEQGVTALIRVFTDGVLTSETPQPWDSGIEGPAILWCDDTSLSLEPASSGWIHVFTRS